MRHRGLDARDTAPARLSIDHPSALRTRQVVSRLVDTDLPGVGAGATDLRWRALFDCGRGRVGGPAPRRDEDARRRRAQPLSVASSLDPWETPALRSTRTGTVHFRDHPIERIVGPADWYLRRPGFWHAAIGPAACWAGAAAAFLDDIDEGDDADPHRLVARGAMRAEVVLALAVLDHAGRATDAEPHDSSAARYRAYAARHLIERSCARLLDAYERAWGPRPFVGSAMRAQRAIDLRLYLRQHHGDRDLAAFGASRSRPGGSGAVRTNGATAS